MNPLDCEKWARRIAAYLGCCLLFFAIAAPVSGDDGPSQAGRQVTVGLPQSFPPYYLLDEDGNPTGFAVDVMNQVAKRAGLLVTYRVKKNWGEIFKALRSGDIDIVPNLGITEGRREYAAFTVPLETFRISIFVRDDTHDVKGLGDLSGRPVGVVTTNAAHRLLKSRDDIQLRVFDNFTEALFALLSAEIDGFAFPEPVTWKLAREARVDKQIKVVGEPLKEIKRGMAVPKDKTELLAVLDRAVRDFLASPEYQKIYVAWFGKPAPYWTVPRVAWTMGGAMAVLFLFMGWWRYRSVLRLNQSLRESEKLFLAAFDQNAVGMAIRDVGPRDSRWLRVNQKFCDIFGYTREEMLRLTSIDVSPPEEQHIAIEFNEQLLRGEIESYSRDKRYVRKDGNIFWANIWLSPILDPDGKPTQLIQVLQDITERKQAEEALRESEERFRNVINNSPAFISLKDKDGHYKLVNKEHTALFGFEQQEIAGKRISEVLHKKVAVKATAQDREVIETKGVVVEERPITTKKGTLDVLITKFPILDQSGAVKEVGTIGVDITELKQAEEDRRLALVDAERANQAKSEFLATMSHELRTPLNAILGFSDILSHQYFGPLGEGKYREYAEDIHASGEHLLELVNDLLDISTIEAGKQSLVKENLSTDEMVRESAKFITEKAQSKGIELVTEVPENLPPLYADSRAIKQILLNLLSNSIKFSPEGSKITVSAKASKWNTALKVADTGQGIPPEKLPELTDPFTRGEQDPHKSIDGWGLGLSITKSLVELHDGTLDIKSKVGKGTTVTVTLPNGAP